MPERSRNRTRLRTIEDLYQVKSDCITKRNKSHLNFVSGFDIQGAGFTATGYNASGGIQSQVIDKFNFNTETCAALSAAITLGRSAGIGATSRLKGFITGGYTGQGGVASYATIEQVQYLSETWGTMTATLATARANVGSFWSPENMYIFGGNTSTGTYYDEIDGMRISSETSINPAASLSALRASVAGLQTEFVGYACGGYVTSPTAGPVDTVERFLFSNESISASSHTLPIATRMMTPVCSSIKGYLMGGYTSTKVNTIKTLNFSDETTAQISATLSKAKYVAGGVFNSVLGYMMGGYTTTLTADIQGIRYSDETIIDPTAALSQARHSPCCMSCLFNT